MRKLEDLKKQAIDEIYEEKAEIRRKKEEVIKNKIKDKNKNIETHHNHIKYLEEQIIETKELIQKIKGEIDEIKEEDIENVNFYTELAIGGVSDYDHRYLGIAAEDCKKGMICTINTKGHVFVA